MLDPRPETAFDRPEVEMLLDLCFAPGRTALSSYRLRDGVAPVAPLCLILRDGSGDEWTEGGEGPGVLLGAIRYWPVQVGGRSVLLLGPVAIHPTAQGEGLGGALIRGSLARAGALGWARVMLVGDSPYYSRFGFSRLDGVEMPPPTNPERVLGLELVPGAWVGVRGPVERETRALPPSGGPPEGPEAVGEAAHGARRPGCKTSDGVPVAREGAGKESE